MENVVDNQFSRNSSVACWGGRVLFVYFIFSIAVVGFVIAYCVTLPASILATRWAGFRVLAAKSLQTGVRILMFLQPWYQIKVTAPDLSAVLRQKRSILFISNHRSHLDVFILLTLIPGIRVLARRNLFAIPGLGTIMRATRQIPLDSGSIDGFFQTMNYIKTQIDQGERVHIFPELTRTEPGSRELRAFSLPPFKTAIESKALLIPIVFKNTDRVWPKGDWSLLRSPIGVEFLNPIDSTQFESAQALALTAQTVISERLK